MRNNSQFTVQQAYNIVRKRHPDYVAHNNIASDYGSFYGFSLCTRPNQFRDDLFSGSCIDAVDKKNGIVFAYDVLWEEIIPYINGEKVLDDIQIKYLNDHKTKSSIIDLGKMGIQ